jgi:hypothetical protein
MAEQDHEMAEGDGCGRLRASHADRERVIDRLKAAYVYGLVTGVRCRAAIYRTETAP